MTEAEVEMVERHIDKIAAGLARERQQWKQRVATLEAQLKRCEAEIAALRGVL